MKRILIIFTLILLTACSKKSNIKNIPLPEPEIDNQFSIDKNINMNTIDDYLFLDDVAYRDVRMLFDPASFGDIGGESDLTATIEGFKIVPYPYIASLQALPVDNAYNGNRLYNVKWTSDGKIEKAEAIYKESKLILEDLFPKDKKIFIMCGGGGYANMMKELLIYLGWDESKLYNVGANWNYKGRYKKELVVFPENVNDDKIYATWRADYAYIEFSKLHKVE